MTTLYRADDPHLLTSMLSGEGIHLEPWQEWFNNCAASGFTGIPEHAADGWPAVPPNRWDTLRTPGL